VPVFEKRLTAAPGGLLAPTLTTGTPRHGTLARAAGQNGWVVDPFPAAVTTDTPASPSSRMRANRADSCTTLCGVSW
jgi:hypothetical protein